MVWEHSALALRLTSFLSNARDFHKTSLDSGDGRHRQRSRSSISRSNIQAESSVLRCGNR